MTADIPRLSIQRLASMIAALDHPFANKRSILADAGLTEDQWREVRQRYQARITSAQGGDQPRRFAEAFDKARKALAGGSPPAEVAKLGPDEPGGEVPAPTAPAQAVTPGPTAVHPPPAPSVALGGMHLGGPPLTASGPASAIDETAAFSAALLDAQALPFSEQQPPPASKTSDELVPHPEVGETSWEIPALDPEHLPFGPSAAAPAEPGPEHHDMDETAALGMAAIVDDEPLPFADSPAAAVPQGSAVEPVAHRARGKTAYLRVADGKPALPFDGGSEPPPHAPKRLFACAPFTLEQLAAVHVELELSPANHAAVLAYYQLTPEVKHGLDRELLALVERDGAAQAAWDEACRIYRNWRRGQ